MNNEVWTIRVLDPDSKSDCQAIEALLDAKLYARGEATLYGVFTPDNSLVAVMGGAPPSLLRQYIGSAESLVVEDD